MQRTTRFREIKYTIYEFSIIVQINLLIYYKKDFINNYFNSITIFQKSEFNYIITQCYDYLFRIVNNSYTYILGKLLKIYIIYQIYYFLYYCNLSAIFTIMYGACVNQRAVFFCFYFE